MTAVDPTTAAIEVQIAERDLLRSENVRMGTMLAETIVERDRLLRCLEVEKARVSMLHSLANDACAELYDTGGEFATKAADLIMKALKKTMEGL